MKELELLGHSIGGSKEQRITMLEALGYQAQRASDNPHYFWQQAEHLKRHNNSSNKIMKNKLK